MRRNWALYAGVMTAIYAATTLPATAQEEEIDEIISEPMPDRGVGKAINDKLRKAAVKN